MLPTTTFQMKDRQFVRYCFEILYYLNLNDINESFLTDLLKRTLVKADELDLDSSLFLVFITLKNLKIRVYSGRAHQGLSE